METAKEFTAEVRKAEQLHKECELTLDRIIKALSGSQKTEFFSNEKERLRLVKIYEEYQRLAQREIQTLNECLRKLESVQNIDTRIMSPSEAADTSASKASNEETSDEEETEDESPSKKRKSEGFMRELIKWKGKGAPPALCGSVPPSPGYIIPVGDQVAAKIQGKKGYENPEWILAQVVKYFPDRQKYEIEDEDPGDEDNPIVNRKHYFIPAKNLIPLPKYEPENWLQVPQAEFAKNTYVLALFPGTTSFYRARVILTPRRKKLHDYVLQFDDDEGERGGTMRRQVPVQFVVPLQQ